MSNPGLKSGPTPPGATGTDWRKIVKRKRNAEGSRRSAADKRQMPRVPIKRADGTSVRLSRSVLPLVRTAIREFCSRWTPGGKLVYVEDTVEKRAHFDEPLLKSLGVTIEAHGEMPDVVVHIKEKNWLVLIEAVTSHGPVNPKRWNELKTLFKGSKAGLVFVTAFLDRQAMTKYLSEISWETEVWVADAPSHLIHFNGEGFLGPYQE